MSNSALDFGTLEQQLVEAIKFDFVDELTLKEYLVEHPRLLSLKARQIAEDIAGKAERAGNHNVTRRIYVFLSLLDIFWSTTVVVPILVGYKYMPNKELSDLLNSFGIDSTDKLYKKLDQRNDLWQEIASHVISGLSVEDWGIIAFLNAIVTKSHELIRVVEEYPTLISYDTNRKILILLGLANERKIKLYPESVQEAINFLDKARKKIDNGILILHNPKVMKMCSKYVYADSWDEAKEVIENNQSFLLTDTGLDEMASLVDGAVIYGFLGEGDWELAAHAMQKYEVLVKCKLYGYEEVFSEWRIPTIIPELWGLGAIIFAGSPSIRTLSGFEDALEINDGNLIRRAKWIDLFLNPNFSKPSTEKELKLFQKELSDLSPVDLLSFQIYGFIYFALKSESDVICELIKTGQVMNSEKMISCLEYLINLALERNPETLIEPIQGIKEWILSPYKDIFLESLENLGQFEVEKLAPNGSDLASVLGGLIKLSRIQSKAEKIKELDKLPILASKESIELIVKIVDQLESAGQRDLASLLVNTINVLKEIDSYGSIASSFMNLLPKDRQLPEYINAVFAWIGTDTEEKADKAVIDFPILFSEEAIDLIHGLINSPEVNQKIFSLGSIEVIDSFDFFSRKYANLLKSKRSFTEKDYRRTVPNASFMDAADLLMELEITIPSRLWLPVNRVDLTRNLFELTSLWISELNDTFGYPSSKNLRIVQEHLVDWDSNFTKTSSENDASLSRILANILSVYDTENLNEVLSIAEENKEIFCQNSIDILCDWIYVAKDLQVNQLIIKLEQIKLWVEQSFLKHIDPSVGLIELSSSPEHRKALTVVAKNFFGFENIENHTDLWNALSNLPEDQYETVFQRAVEAAEATGNPEQIAFAKKFRLELLRMKIVNAAQSGKTEEIAKVFINNPLIFDPEMIDFMFKDSLPEIREKIEVIRFMSADPLFMKEMLGEELTDDEKDQINALDAKITAIYYFDSWYLRLIAIKHNPEVLSNSGWANINIGYKRHLETLSNLLHEERDAIIERMQQVIEFIKQCRNTSFDQAMKEKLCGSLGIDINKHWADDAVDSFELTMSLPLSISRKLVGITDEVEVAHFYEQLDQSENLSSDLRATLYMQVGIAYGTAFERNGDLLLVDKSIDAYRKSVELTVENGRRKASRLTWLGNTLRKKFDDFGKNLSDMAEAIKCLQDASSQPGITNQLRGYCLGHLSMAVLSRYQAFGSVDDIEGSISLSEEAIGLTPAGSQDWVGWHLNLGLAKYTYAKEFKNSKSFLEAFEIYQIGLNNIIEFSDTWWLLKFNQISILDDLGYLDREISEYQSIDISKIPSDKLINFNWNYGVALLNRFRTEGHVSDIDQSISLLYKALDLVKPETPDWLRVISNLLGAIRERVEFDNKFDYSYDLGKLVELILNTEQLYTWPNIVYDACEVLGNYYGKRGEYQKAVIAYKKAIEALDIMWNFTSLIDDRLYLSKKNEAVYARLVYSCLQANEINEAFEFSNKAKARVFLDMLAFSNISTISENYDSETLGLIKEGKNLQGRLQYLRGLLTGEQKERVYVDGKAPSLDYAQIMIEVRSLEAKLSKVLEHLRNLNPLLNDIGIAEPLKYFEALQIADETEAVLIDFHIDLAGWGAFVVTPHQIIHFRIGQHDFPWDEWIRNLTVIGTEQISKTDSFHNTLRDLYDCFIFPLKSLLPEPGSRIILSPTYLLNLFPLCSAQSEDGEYLFGEYDVVLIPSLSALKTITQRNISKDFRNMLIVGYPGSKENGTYLSHVLSEVRVIKNIAKDATILENEDANIENVRQAAPENSIIHFACHGIINWSRPDESGLILSCGEWLTIRRIIADLNIPKTYLVVLAACDLGLEFNRNGDEHQSLVRAFLCAGASSVIASLWPVDDLSTELLMGNFYKKHLHEKVQPSAALKQAQLWLKNITRKEVASYLLNEAMISTKEKVLLFSDFVMAGRPDDKPFSHPYYWAGFYFAGL